MIELSPTVLTLVAGTLVPLAVALLTKANTSRTVKSIVNVILSAVAAVAIQAANDNGLVTEATLVLGFQVFVTGVAAYYGFEKPVGLAPTVSEKTANVGI